MFKNICFSGDTNIDSVVYRYDLAKKYFVVHQKLRTHAGVDVSFFSMNRSRGKDHFLVVANSYYQGESHIVLYIHLLFGSGWGRWTYKIPR